MKKEGIGPTGTSAITIKVVTALACCQSWLIASKPKHRQRQEHALKKCYCHHTLQCQRSWWRWVAAYDKPLKASSSAFSPVISEEAFSHRQVTSRKVWGESITATVMFLLRDNHRLWPPFLFLLLSGLLAMNHLFSSFPLTFCLVAPLASTHLIFFVFFTPCLCPLPFSLLFLLLLAPSRVSSHFSITSLCLCEVSEKIWNQSLKYQISFLYKGFSPLLFGHREAQFTTPASHLDNYCEQGTQRQQKKIHDYLYPGLQALRQKGEEIEGETKTDRWFCLEGLQRERICVF